MRLPSRSDLAYLQRSLLLFMLCLFSSAAMMWLSFSFLQHTESGLEQDKHLLISVRSRLKTIQDESAKLPEYSARYAALSNQKILSDENRLDLMESLEQARKSYRLRNFRYNIAPQEAFLHEAAMTSRISNLNMQTSLIHEVQLLEFLSALRSASNGLFIVKGCTLELNATPGPVSTEDLVYPLHAECDGGWVTMRYGLQP